MLHELIELIHVDIGKELRRQVSDGYSLTARSAVYSLSLSLSLAKSRVARITVYNLSKQFLCFGVFDSPFQYFNKGRVVYGVEELPNIAFKDEASPRVVSAYLPYDTREEIHAPMRAFAYPAGKRSRDEGRLENRVKNPKQRVVQNPIAYRRLMNTPPFWVVNPERGIRAVSIVTAFQLTVQVEDV